MGSSVSGTTAPVRKMTPQERGRAGMRSRWGPQRIVRLDQLDPVTANIIRTIIDARANAAKAAEAVAGTAESEGAA